MPRLITRYIFKEMAVPFLLCAVILTVTALLGKLVKLIELIFTEGVGAGNVAALTITMLPQLLIYTVPTAFLVGVLIASTRLSSESEIIAMKSSGIGLFTIVRPVFLLALVCCALTLFITMYVAPYGHLKAQKTLFEIARTKATVGITERTFYDKYPGVVLYVDHIPVGGGELRGVFISDNTSDSTNGDAGAGGGERIIIAEKGVFVPDSEGQKMGFRLERGSIHQRGEKSGQYHQLKFSDYTLQLDIGSAGKARTLKWNRELYTGELIERIEALRRAGGKTIRPTIMLHKRFASAAIVFAFMLVALPLGMQKIRSGRTAGFGLSVGVLLAYYIVSKIFETLAYNGNVSPAVGVWGSVAVIGAFGLYIFISAAKEKQPIRVSAIEELFSKISKRASNAIGFRK